MTIVDVINLLDHVCILQTKRLFKKTQATTKNDTPFKFSCQGRLV